MNDKEFVKKKARKIIERAKQNGYPTKFAERTPVESNKRDSFSENMKSQEQADLFLKLIKMLREEKK